MYSIYIAIKSETYIKPSTTLEQTICRPINVYRSRPTALSFFSTNPVQQCIRIRQIHIYKQSWSSDSNLSLSFEFRHCLLDFSCVYVCLWA